MTILKIRFFPQIFIFLLFLSCQSSKKGINYFNVFNPEIEKSLIEIKQKEPKNKFITISFKKTKLGKEYLFISSQLFLNSIKTKYYFEHKNQLILVTFDDLDSSTKYLNNNNNNNNNIFKEFNNSKTLDFYENIVIVFEIINSQILCRINNPNASILELNNINSIKFIPPKKI